jgi:hypothetical protein
MMLRGLAPSVRRMAMSARLSVTVMTSVDQVERRHGHDEREDDEHHAFFQLHRRKPGAVGAASSRAPASHR